MKHFVLTGTNLTIDDLTYIARAKVGEVQVSIDPKSMERMKKCPPNGS